MGNMNYAGPCFFCHGPDLFFDPVFQGWVQAGKRFVQEQQPGGDGKGPGNGDPLVHASGQFPGIVGFKPGQSQILEKS